MKIIELVPKMNPSQKIRLYVKENTEVYEVINCESDQLIERIIYPLGQSFIDFVDINIHDLMNRTLFNSYEMLLKLRTAKANSLYYAKLTEDERRYHKKTNYEVDRELEELSAASKLLKNQHIFFYPVCNDIDLLLFEYTKNNRNISSYTALTRYSYDLIGIHNIISKFIFYFSDVDNKVTKSPKARFADFVKSKDEIEKYINDNRMNLDTKFNFNFLKMKNEFEFEFFPEEKYNYTGFSNSELELAQVFYPSNIMDIANYLMIKLLMSNVKFRECQNCGKAFIISGRGNTKYCDRKIDNSNKTCRDLGATKFYKSEKEKEPVYHLYTKAYKKQSARLRYGNITREMFNTWGTIAREMREKCKKGEMTLLAFEDYLNSDDYTLHE